MRSYIAWVLCRFSKSLSLRNALLSKKIIISVDGPDENVLKIKSPMCVTIENAEQLLKALAETLNELSE